MIIEINKEHFKKNTSSILNIAIIKYNAGNIQSVLYALERIGATAVVTDDAEKISTADRVIFPGVGEAGSAMQYLKQHKLDRLILDLKQPVLGICLGMQLMCRHTEESNTDCLNIFDVDIKKFQPGDSGLKVPQIGWNNIYDLKTVLFEKVEENAFIYSVHSYYAAMSPYTIATAEYIHQYSAGLHRDNFYGVQFHPEKSATIGEQILKNFISS